MSHLKRILVFIPYPFGSMNVAPRVRAYNIYKALDSLCDVILVTGSLTGLSSLFRANRTDIPDLRLRSRFLEEFCCMMDRRLTSSVDYM